MHGIFKYDGDTDVDVGTHDPRFLRHREGNDVGVVMVIEVADIRFLDHALRAEDVVDLSHAIALALTHELYRGANLAFVA